MKQLSPKQIERYRASREKGLLNFILVRGILLWGVPIGAGFALYKQFANNDMTGWTIGFPIWVMGGILFGWLLWVVERKTFERYLANQEKRPPE